MKWLAIAFCAATALFGSALHGYHVHKWLVTKSPRLARIIPGDTGVFLGLAVGLMGLTVWFRAL